VKGSRSRNRSSLITSSQHQVHPRLEEVVKRHLETTWRGDMHQPSVEAFRKLVEMIGDDNQKQIIFDSGCGTGETTRDIARVFPECLVIGIDRSEKRLGRLCGGDWPTETNLWSENNAIWVRAELTTFWRIALAANWRLHKHFVLYPNPYPKPGQLKRRWHAHPVFPVLLALGGQLDLRSNWLLYMQEFAEAVNLATGSNPDITTMGESNISSPFEEKYRRSDHQLYRLRFDLGSGY
jgi:tRNA G46 methylase TrmB